MFIIDKLIKLCEKEKEVEISKEEIDDIAKGLKINWNEVDFSITDLLEGTKTEFSEHKNVHHGNFEIASKIALDHLRELPDYYKKLKEANL